MFAFCLTSAIGNVSYDKDAIIENCILEMKTGSKESLSKFYELCKGAIYGFALSILKNKQDAEDVLQDVLLKIYNSAEYYKANGKPMPWVLTITKNFSIMKIRERQKVSFETSEEWEKIGFTEDTLDEEDKYFLNDLLSVLSDEERQIVLLKACAGLKHRDIAKLLDIHLSTCLSKYNRAIKKLQNNCERR